MSVRKPYAVWDAPTRAFHWINLLCVLLLVALGTTILNGKSLGITNDGKVLLKTLHVWVGYAFILNLLVRIGWAFAGNHYARWAQWLPLGRSFAAQWRQWRASRGTAALEFAGHTPPGRIAIGAMLLLMISQSTTGLLLAGTDLYYPPFGSWIAEWIAAPGVDPATLVPYQPDLVDAAAVSEMRAMRKPYAQFHVWGFYALLAAVAVHLTGVIWAERRHGSALVSAMITGRKWLASDPVDPKP